MSITIEEIIAKAEADLAKARRRFSDLTEAYEREAKPLWMEIAVNERIIGTLQAALSASTAPTPVAASVFSEISPDDLIGLDDFLKPEIVAPAPAPAPAPAVKETKPAPLPAAVGANGFDRVAIRHQLREWHIGYPLGRSYRSPSQMMRQALKATIMDSVGYRADWLANGGVDFGNSSSHTTMETLYAAALALGVDFNRVMNEAHRVRRLIGHYGTPGTDYLWNEASA